MTPVVEAALCLVALPILKRIGLDGGVSGRGVVERLGVARSHAYEVAKSLPDRLVHSEHARTGSDADDELERLRIRVAVLEYRVDHPGSWVTGGRTVYSGELRAFVLELAQHHAVGTKMTQADFAAACNIPLPTLKDWWAGELAQLDLPLSPSEEKESAAEVVESEPAGDGKSDTESTSAPAGTPSDDGVRFSLEMCRILREWERWQGSFAGFVAHLRELGLRYGKTWLMGLLYLAAARKLVRRPPPQPQARGSTFRPLPSLQWTSDGKQFDVVVNGEAYTITWQPMVDVGSAAFVGSTVRPEEDTAGVLTSLNDGIQTTGASPAALLVDNKACNKSAALEEGLPAGTFLMHSTVGRAQNKATVEGSFGLFAQDLGPVVAVVDTSTPDRAAQTVGEAVVRAYAQGRNQKPRRDGQTRREIYLDTERPPEKVAADIERLRAIKERIDTREAREAARRDPRVMAAIEEACRRFGFFDDGDIAVSLRDLPLAAIESATAIYAAKLDAGSLPLDAGLRYFAGIARNWHTEFELRRFEDHLVDVLRHRDDVVLVHLEDKANVLNTRGLSERLLAIIDELLTTEPHPAAQSFWRRRLVAEAATAHAALRDALRRLLCARIRRHYAASKAHRQHLVDLVVRSFTLPTSTVTA
jgi:hypothetical protein